MYNHLDQTIITYTLYDLSYHNITIVILYYSNINSIIHYNNDIIIITYI